MVAPWLFSLTTQDRYPEKTRGVSGFEGGLHITSLATKNSNENDSLRDEDVVCDNIESLSINGAPETTGVTAFVQEACTQVEVLGAHHKPSKIMKLQPDLQELTHYFSRPRQIFSGVLPIARGVVFNNGFTGISVNNYFPGWSDRIQGTYGYKFTLVYTLQVAATPFHQGLLALAWQYGNANSQFDRNGQPAAVTNLPHVRLDLSKDTMVQLKVPWLYPIEYFPGYTNGYLFTNAAIGSIGLTALGGVPAVAGMNSATYKVYVHLEDMEFFGALPYIPSAITVQSGISEELKSNPFSSQVGVISKALRMVSRGVPALSGLSSTVAWYTDAVAGTLKSFGYSKPTIMDPMARMMKTSTALEQNVDFPTPVSVVGPFASNSLQTDTTFSNSDVDEMALSFVVSQYSQINYGALTSAMTSGNVIYASNVCPGNMWYRAGSSIPYCNVGAPLTLKGAPANSFLPSSVFMASSMFRLWKGDLIFRFTFIKTKMHGGRIMAAFTPTSTFSYTDTIDDSYLPVNGAEISPTVQPYGNSMLMDLRDNNVFEFTVPYISPVPYSGFNSPIGGLTLTIMDPLQVSSVISSTVNFMVEVKAASNFELAIPRGVLYPSHVVGAIRTQSGLLTNTELDSVSKYTIGEKLNSFKQLIMIPEVASLSSPVGNYDANILPWYYQPPIPTTSPSPVAYTLPKQAFSYGGNISKCYAYVRGSTDVHTYVNASNVMVNYRAVPSTGGNYVKNGATLLSASNSSLPMVFSSDGCSSHARFPSYQRFVRVPSGTYDLQNWSISSNPLVNFGGNAGNNAYVSPAMPLMQLVNANSTNVLCQISRNAGDDAAMCMYQGPVPLYLPSVIASSPIYDPTYYN